MAPLALAALCLTGCHKPLTHAECSEMLDHYVELLVRSERPKASSQELLRLQGEARREAAGDPNFASCSAQVSRRQWQCAMHAQNPDELERCLM